MSRRQKTYKECLAEIFSHLSEARAKRERLQNLLADVDARIDGLEEAARTMGGLCGIDPIKAHPELFPEEADPELGFTDSVREALRRACAAGAYTSPLHIRNVLREMGFPLDQYTNPLASIHTILKRLTLQGELDMVVLDDVTRYTLKRPGTEDLKEGEAGSN